MSFTAGQAYGAFETLKKLQGEKLPIKGKYWCARLISKLEPEIKTIEEQRNELIKKHGEEVDGQIRVANGKVADFMFDFNAVLTEEIKGEFPRIKLELLGDGEIETDLTPLMPFIDE